MSGAAWQRRLAGAVAAAAAGLLAAASGASSAPGAAAPGEPAGAYAWPRLERTEPQAKQFVATRVYRFQERRFVPPVLVAQLDAPVWNIRTPEQTVFELVSAMRAGDYDWWYENHDPDARRAIDAANESLGKRPQDWVEAWRVHFAGRTVTLERWIEFGRYLILTYRLGARSARAGEGGYPAADPEEVPVVLSVKSGGWRETFDLDDSPVVRYFNAPGLASGSSLRLRRVVR